MAKSNKGIFELINEIDKSTLAKSSSEVAHLPLEIDYEQQLDNLRTWLSGNYAAELARIIGDKKATERIKSLIRQFVQQNFIEADADYSSLIERLYDDLAGFAFINKFLYDESIEEINGNAWDDIELVRSTKWQKINERFLNPQHAIDVIKKMMRIGGVTLDEKQPQGDSFISTGVRISAMIPPVIDEEVGAVFSIRKQKTRIFTKKELVAANTCTELEFDFLQICLNHRISVGIAGATSSGKTTDIIAILDSLAINKRIYIIEDTRETFVTKRLESGSVLNRVIYTKTRPSESQARSVSASDLLRAAMRYHPDIIVPAEMRDEVAMVAVEAGRTGHAILAGLHANSAIEAYDRILTMCMMSGTKLSEELLMRLIISAFPIMLYKAQLPDKSRKYMEIFEAISFDTSTNVLHGTVLFQYSVIDKQIDSQGQVMKIIGEHQQVGKISNRLANHLLIYGCDFEKIRQYAHQDWHPGR